MASTSVFCMKDMLLNDNRICPSWYWDYVSPSAFLLKQKSSSLIRGRQRM